MAENISSSDNTPPPVPTHITSLVDQWRFCVALIPNTLHLVALLDQMNKMDFFHLQYNEDIS